MTGSGPHAPRNRRPSDPTCYYLYNGSIAGDARNRLWMKPFADVCNRHMRCTEPAHAACRRSLQPGCLAAACVPCAFDWRAYPSPLHRGGEQPGEHRAKTDSDLARSPGNDRPAAQRARATRSPSGPRMRLSGPYDSDIGEGPQGRPTIQDDADTCCLAVYNVRTWDTAVVTRPSLRCPFRSPLNCLDSNSACCCGVIFAL